MLWNSVENRKFTFDKKFAREAHDGMRQLFKLAYSRPLDRSRQLSGLLLFQASVNAVAEIPKA